MPDEEMSKSDRKILECRGVTKRFPGVIANDQVDFTLRKGEIHALLGENGAGKTTLMNCVYGLYKPDEGDILLNGKSLSLRSPADAIKHQIGMIHQHFMLIPTLSVVENVALCLSDQNPLRLNLDQVEKRIIELSNRYSLEIDPLAMVSDLSVGAQQRVEILKVLYRDANILIMDEPTAVLTPNEVESLFQVLRDIANQGNSVIFISHKLWEVMIITDRVTVLRDGKRVAAVNTENTSKEQLAEMMVGREVFLQYEHPKVEQGEPVLELRSISALDQNKRQTLKNIDLQVRAGEIVGIAGVAGNGQKELADVIHGLLEIDEGRILFQGEDMTELNTDKRIKLGLGHIPEDRLTTGIVPGFSVAENIVLIEFDQEPFTQNGLYRPKEVDRRTLELQDQFDIRMASIKVPVESLSGGNQQKVVLAREISRAPQLLLAAQPSRGLDIGATEFIQKKLIEERNNGRAVLLISTDLDEILSVSDRVLVLYEGEIMGEVIPGETSIREIGLMMTGTNMLSLPEYS